MRSKIKMKKIIYLIFILSILIFYRANAQTNEPYPLRLPSAPPAYTTTFSDTASNTGGKIHYYTAISNPGLQQADNVITNPFVNLNIYVQGANLSIPKVNKGAIPPEVKGILNIKTEAQSLQNIKNYKIYLYKYDKTVSDYRPVNINGPSQYCSFLCDTQNCNLLEEKLVAQAADKSCIQNPSSSCTFNLAFDTKRCDNQNFMVNVTVYDNYPNQDSGYNYNTDTIFFNVNNLAPPIIPPLGGVEKPRLFSSDILNTVYLKIKSWIS